MISSRGLKYYKVIRQNFVFYLKTSKFYYSYNLFLSLNIKILITSNFYWQNFMVFITSKDFFEIYSSKMFRKC